MITIHLLNDPDLGLDEVLPELGPQLTSQAQGSDLLVYLLNLTSAGLLRSSVEMRKLDSADV